MTSPNKETVISECYIDNPMSFGSGKNETTILYEGEDYNPRKPGNFDGYNILGWIGNDTLRVIKFHKKLTTR